MRFLSGQHGVRSRVRRRRRRRPARPRARAAPGPAWPMCWRHPTPAWWPRPWPPRPSSRSPTSTVGLPIPSPRRILCVGLNYHDHRAESAAKATSEHPTFFTRFVSSLVPDGVPLERPRASDVFDYEGELAVVIGRARAGPSRVADALDHVGGYACFMDGSVRDYQRHSSQFTAGKNFDRSGSFGPVARHARTRSTCRPPSCARPSTARRSSTRRSRT